MISQENINWISKLSGVSVEEISGALTNEQEVNLPLKLNGRVISSEDEKKLREDGVQQGKELASKDLAKHLNITLDSGEKDPEIISQKLLTKLSSELEEKFKDRSPSEELEAAKKAAEEAQKKYDKLSQTLKEKEKEVELSTKQLSEFKTNYRLKEAKSNLTKYFKDPDKVGLTYDQQLTLFELDNSIELLEEGYKIKPKNGDEYRNSLGEPETEENIVKGWLENQSFVKKRGMGGSDDKGQRKVSGGKTPDDAMRIIKEKGIPPASQEGLKLYSELTAKE